MIGNIETDQDFLSEKERLVAEAEMHKGQIKQTIKTLKDEVKPSNLAKDVLGSSFTPELLKYGACIGSFVLVNALLPRRTSWLIKAVVPFIANRYLSKYIDQNYYTWSNQIVDQIDHAETERKLNKSIAYND
ncbi:hypothetical protein QNI19_05145 [Cytophagaceae bacterium DM2B3-1]|uniref:Uncharacterized protein n=2 Tax=Xanthocytophaga TaxID=3078918 RepID=A0AAE3QN20_9BACT|nr:MULTISPECIES: hypothetical protein [Xanthocytophaga]MDJ1472296.1 hypothetical protein [Xanthocytophaga flavus]MDJ1482055.1 hypothetical protein [Xanthocytophaga flavus]MDJ1492307.1 hypothetical protein [Xanthocytophaga flavus]MDJ1499773.1 hypothetical protein [Xanthocytophaga agilis]